MSPRTKLALTQNTIIGVPVIIVISVFNGIFANSSAEIHALGSAVFGYSTSLVMLYITLNLFRIKSRFDQQQQVQPALKNTK